MDPVRGMAQEGRRLVECHDVFVFVDDGQLQVRAGEFLVARITDKDGLSRGHPRGGFYRAAGQEYPAVVDEVLDLIAGIAVQSRAIMFGRLRKL